MKTGRPTSYDPAFCTRVEALGKAGYSKAMIASELGVVRQTLANWAERHPDFLDAMVRAREFSLGWWETQGIAGIWSKDFNANAYRLQMTNRFPDDWRDRQQIEVRGGFANINLDLLPDHVIARIAAGEHPMVVLASATEEVIALLSAPAASERDEIDP